jgi:glyoxylase-like metal-dependent hydrolase (beta-lactamase superfamily II)
VTKTQTFCSEHGLDGTTISALLDLARQFRGRPARFTPMRFWKKKTPLQSGGKMIVVLSTPGHSPGHCSFLLPTEGILISGDFVLSHITPN